MNDASRMQGWAICLGAAFQGEPYRAGLAQQYAITRVNLQPEGIALHDDPAAPPGFATRRAIAAVRAARQEKRQAGNESEGRCIGCAPLAGSGEGGHTFPLMVTWNRADKPVVHGRLNLLGAACFRSYSG